MTASFFERPILNSPCAYSSQHCELDEAGQPTGKLVEERRRAEFITPIPKPKKRKKGAKQAEIGFDETETRFSRWSTGIVPCVARSPDPRPTHPILDGIGGRSRRRAAVDHPRRCPHAREWRRR